MGEQGTTYTFSCTGSDTGDHMLTVKRNNVGELQLSPSDGWASVEHSDAVFSRFQEGALSAPVLCAKLLMSTAMHEASGTKP